MTSALPNAVLCVGMLNSDVYFSDVPKNLLHTDTTYCRHVEMKIGGDAANVALNMKRLGFTTHVVGNVGADVFGSHTLELLEKAGVDTSMSYRTSARGTAVSLKFFDVDGGYHGASYWGGNMLLSPEMITDDMLKTAKHLHIGSFVNLQSFVGDGVADLLSRAKALGLTVSADVSGGRPIDRPTMEKALPLMDIFALNEEEMEQLTGESDPDKAAEVIRPFHPAILLLKTGEKGATIIDYENGVTVKVPAFAAADTVIDTVGAGDAFLSGFLAAKLSGCGLDLCAVCGAEAASRCVTTLGASQWQADFDGLKAAAAAHLPL